MSDRYIHSPLPVRSTTLAAYRVARGAGRPLLCQAGDSGFVEELIKTDPVILNEILDQLHDESGFWGSIVVPIREHYHRPEFVLKNTTIHHHERSGYQRQLCLEKLRQLPAEYLVFAGGWIDLGAKFKTRVEQDVYLTIDSGLLRQMRV